MVIRLWILSAHYRTQLDFSEESLEQARATLSRIKAAYQALDSILRTVEPRERLTEDDVERLNKVYTLYREFHQAMSTDFNTAKALASILNLVRLVNSSIVPAEDYTSAMAAMKLLLEFNYVFRIADDVIYDGRVPHAELVNRLVDLIVKVRAELRSRRMYDIADTIRAELAQLGIRLYDYPGGKTIWRFEEGRS